MIIEEIKDFYAFLNLEKEWNLLLKKSYSSSVFLSHEWLRCWWEAFGKGKELLILLCKDEDHVLGAFPLMITRDSIHGFPVKKISFIENNETPHCGFLIDNKASLLEIVHALFGHIALYKKSWDILGLRKIPEGNKIIEFVRNYLDDNGYNFIIRKSLQSPILYIKTDWDTFYSGATQRFKKRIRYSINKLRKEGNFFVNKIQKSDEMSSMLEEAFRVGNLSWKGNIGKSIGNTPENRHFFSILPSALESDGSSAVSLWYLCLEGKMIAFEYHIRQSDVVYALRGEYDKTYRAYSPGSILDFEIIRHLFNDNIRFYNMCGSQDEYKLRWTGISQSHWDILVFNNKLYCTFLVFLEKKVRSIIKGALRTHI